MKETEEILANVWKHQYYCYYSIDENNNDNLLLILWKLLKMKKRK